MCIRDRYNICDIAKPVPVPHMAPVEYISRVVMSPNAAWRTLNVHVREIKKPTTSAPENFPLAICHVLSATSVTCT